MVRGAVSGAGLGGLWMMPKITTMNGKMYRNRLRVKLPIFINIHDISHVQQDGAPCHGTRLSNPCWSQKRILLLEPWPGSSPDFNITGSVRTVLKQEVSVHNPTSEADLINWIKAVWVREITPEFCWKLARSMNLCTNIGTENKWYYLQILTVSSIAGCGDTKCCIDSRNNGSNVSFWAMPL